MKIARFLHNGEYVYIRNVILEDGVQYLELEDKTRLVLQFDYYSYIRDVPYFNYGGKTYYLSEDVENLV